MQRDQHDTIDHARLATVTGGAGSDESAKSVPGAARWGSIWAVEGFKNGLHGMPGDPGGTDMQHIHPITAVKRGIEWAQIGAGLGFERGW